MQHAPTIFFVLAIMFISVHVQARTEADVYKELIKASKTAVEVYKKMGCQV